MGVYGNFHPQCQLVRFIKYLRHKCYYFLMKSTALMEQGSREVQHSKLPFFGHSQFTEFVWLGYFCNMHVKKINRSCLTSFSTGTFKE